MREVRKAYLKASDVERIMYFMGETMGKRRGIIKPSSIYQFACTVEFLSSRDNPENFHGAIITLDRWGEHDLIPEMGLLPYH